MEDKAEIIIKVTENNRLIIRVKILMPKGEYATYTKELSVKDAEFDEVLNLITLIAPGHSIEIAADSIICRIIEDREKNYKSHELY